MSHYFTNEIPLEKGVEAFCDLGLDVATMKHGPKKAMKIVMKP
jgi:hypothetical protein